MVQTRRHESCPSVLDDWNNLSRRDFLRRVLRIVQIAKQPPCQCQDPLLVLHDDLFESQSIASNRPLYENGELRLSRRLAFRLDSGHPQRCGTQFHVLMIASGLHLWTAWRLLTAGPVRSGDALLVNEYWKKEKIV